MCRCRFLFVPIVGMFAVGFGVSAAGDADAVKEKLLQAKNEFDLESQKFKQSVEEVFDKREEAARAAGDKKAVDQVKTERNAFLKSGDPPPMVAAASKQRAANARANLDKAYAVATKEYLILKLDTAVDATDKERKDFLLSSGFLMGNRTYLSSLNHFNVKVAKNLPFTNNGTQGDTKIKLKMDGQYVPHSLFMHPSDKDFSAVSYPLAGKYTAFRAVVGVPKIEENTSAPVSSLTFEVLGDGKSLWKSGPVTKIDTFQTCRILVEDVKTLTLRVHCPGAANWARSVWFEPIVVE